MGFRQGSYVTLWGEPKTGRFENIIEWRVSASYKKQGTTEYVQDFGGWVEFRGDAYEKAKSLVAGDRIKILQCDVKNRYVKEKNMTYTNFIVYDFENVTRNGSQTSSAATATTSKTKKTAPIAEEGEVDIDDDNLPF